MSASGIRGVFFDASKGKWLAKLGHKNKQYTIGRYESQREAFIAFDAVARLLFGKMHPPEIDQSILECLSH
jgi:hypothetical protein